LCCVGPVLGKSGSKNRAELVARIAAFISSTRTDFLFCPYACLIDASPKNSTNKSVHFVMRNNASLDMLDTSLSFFIIFLIVACGNTGSLGSLLPLLLVDMGIPPFAINSSISFFHFVNTSTCFAFASAALSVNTALSTSDRLDHLTPSSLPISPIVAVGFSARTIERCLARKRKYPDNGDFGLGGSTSSLTTLVTTTEVVEVELAGEDGACVESGGEEGKEEVVVVVVVVVAVDGVGSSSSIGVASLESIWRVRSQIQLF